MNLENNLAFGLKGERFHFIFDGLFYHALGHTAVKYGGRVFWMIVPRFESRSGFLVFHKSVRAVFAATFTAIASFQVVFFGKHHQTKLVEVIIFRTERAFGSSFWLV
jgi:hypothetical protein